MARLYTKISPAVWTSRRFRALGHEARLLYIYMLTNEHIDSTGCYRLPVGYACSDLGIDPETLRTLTTALVQADLIAVDPEAEYVLVRRWFKHNPPMNRDHLAGTRGRIERIESETLRAECEAEFSKAEAALEERLAAAERAKAERAAKAQLRLPASAPGWKSASSLMDTAFMRGGR